MRRNKKKAFIGSFMIGIDKLKLVVYTHNNIYSNFIIMYTFCG